MKSLCIKTNDSNILNYLLNELKNSEMKEICFSENKFKNYKNIIVHYIGDNVEEFLSQMSYIMCFMIIDIEEEEILKQKLNQNYFYFDSKEREEILAICFNIMADEFPEEFDRKFKILYNNFYKYMETNKSFVLSGFINFRLKEYIDILETVLSNAVNTFVIEKEYLEFISLLQLYINSQPCGCNVIHIVYSKSKAELFDENKNLIVIPDEIFKAKYLSDITFSANDYALNTLLNLLPKKIYVHLVDNYSDEFINTLQLVFEGRVEILPEGTYIFGKKLP